MLILIFESFKGVKGDFFQKIPLVFPAFPLVSILCAPGFIFEIMDWISVRDFAERAEDRSESCCSVGREEKARIDSGSWARAIARPRGMFELLYSIFYTPWGGYFYFGALFFIFGLYGWLIYCIMMILL